MLTVFTRFLYDDFASERDRLQWMTHSYQVISATRALLSNLQDAETGQRGYLLTGDESYRAPFDSALREQQSIRKTLRQLASGDPATSNARQTRPLGGVEVSGTPEDHGAAPAGIDAALAEVRTGEGKRILDECRAVLRGMEERAPALLAKRTEEADAQNIRTRWVLELGSGSPCSVAGDRRRGDRTGQPGS